MGKRKLDSAIDSKLAKHCPSFFQPTRHTAHFQHHTRTHTWTPALTRYKKIVVVGENETFLWVPPPHQKRFPPSPVCNSLRWQKDSPSEQVTRHYSLRNASRKGSLAPSTFPKTKLTNWKVADLFSRPSLMPLKSWQNDAKIDKPSDGQIGFACCTLALVQTFGTVYGEWVLLLTNVTVGKTSEMIKCFVTRAINRSVFLLLCKKLSISPAFGEHFRQEPLKSI